MLSFLTLSLATCSALQLGVARVPAAVRGAALRMQVPLTSDAAAAAPEPDEPPLAGVVVPAPTGVVVPTEGIRALSAASEAQLARMLAKGSEELSTPFRRAEFWNKNETAVMVELLNVLGRFTTADQFKERTMFSEVEYRDEDDRQAETEKRHQMALRMGCSERVALYQIVPALPFTNAALAATYGLTVEDFEGLEVSRAACSIVYDALAESKSGLIPYATIDARRAGMLDNEVAFNEASFRAGLYKSRFAICVAWFLFGKGNWVWVVVIAKFLHDWKPDVIPSPVELGLFKIGAFI